jgi:membrane-associated phospholipid phosphatase
MIETRNAAALTRRGTPYQKKLLAIATVLLVVGMAAFSIDLPIAAWCKAGRLRGDVGRFVNLLEITGNSGGAAVILIAAVTLDRGLRLPLSWHLTDGMQAFLRMVAATYLGGLVVDVIKISVPRVRPQACDLAAVGAWIETFGSGARAAAATGDSVLRSFPSGHSAVAAGLAAALAWRYPHGWPLFAALAVATGFHRVITSAHYPSDVALGAAVGLIAAACCLGGPRPPGHGVARGDTA